MTRHPERYIGLCFLLLALAVVAPPVVDWLRTGSQLPPGYGAEGDRRRAGRIPATAADAWRGTNLPGPVQVTVEACSAGAEASWVKGAVEKGIRVYELNVLKNNKWSVIRIDSNGRVIPPEAREAEPGGVVEAGG